MKVVAIVQARLESTRFPNKILALIGNVPSLEYQIHRLSKSSLIDEIVVAMPETLANQKLKDWIEGLGCSVFFGSESDVLSRFYLAAVKCKAELIVRITADCPLIDAELVDKVIKNFFENPNCGISTNTQPPSFPDGLDCSVFSFQALELAYQKAFSQQDREHVTPYLYREFKNKLININCTEDNSTLRITLDERIDLQVINLITDRLGISGDFSYLDILKLSKIEPEIFALNRNIVRNEGVSMGTGQKLYRRAKAVIPGGTMLFSKRPENFLPEHWPAYFLKAKGCEVWDLDGNRFIDVSMMGIGTNTLGYGNEEVDEAVIAAVLSGNMSTLNGPEEVYLAERLIEIHPWAGKVKFARTGGEATAIAIRIARAHTSKDKVAFCGYHGWTDWYLSANIENPSNLSSHLMAGLESRGVPTALAGTSIPFIFNDFDSFDKAVSDDQIGTVIMEVMRNSEPALGFLEHVREVTHKKGIVLVFDECTTGFRETFGGIHKKYNINPDLATFGKALGNGYAITAVIGKNEVMKSANDSFISSTFWTERIGSVAALKTLEVMEKTKSWEILPVHGQSVSEGWLRIGIKHGIDFSIFGINSMIKFKLNSSSNQIFKTFLTQEMLKEGYLAGTQFNASTAHNPLIIGAYLEVLESVIGKYCKAINEGTDLPSLINGPIATTEFKRLN